jgi:hypothetical protein
LSLVVLYTVNTIKLTVGCSIPSDNLLGSLQATDSLLVIQSTNRHANFSSGLWWWHCNRLYISTANHKILKFDMVSSNVQIKCITTTAANV